MRAAGRQGFTLIELLIVVVIIGILASIAIPKFSNTKEKAYLAQMKHDLKNMAVVEEGYLSDNQVYVGGTATNQNSTQTSIQSFVPSSGVQLTVAATAGTGWSATTSHLYTTKTCAIFIGVSAVSPATVEGEPKCN